MRLTRVVRRCEQGMCTVEYAVGTVASCAFACILFQVLTHWRGALAGLLLKAFQVRFGWLGGIF